MLDQVKLQCAEMLARGIAKTRIAEELKISRSSIYDWEKLEEFKTEVDKNKHEFLLQSQRLLSANAVDATETLVKLMKTARSEKVRLAAAQDIADRTHGKATTRVEYSEQNKGKDVTIDVLEEEFKQFDEE